MGNSKINELIQCACGCGQYKLKFRSQYRLSSIYITGHYPRTQKTNKQLYPSGTKLCNGCNKRKKLDKFGKTKDKNGRIYIRTRCKLCNNKYQKNYSIKLGSKYLKMRKNGKEKRKNNNPVRYFITERLASYRKNKSNLTTEYLEKLWYSQKGLCYLTGEKMIPNGGSGTNSPACNSMSLDKLNPKLGYTIGNVAWCTYQANTSKGSRTLDEFYEFCRIVLIKCGELS